MKKLILCDFDGTITKQDTLVKILDTYAGPRWRVIEKRIQGEGFGNRMGLREEFSLCNPTKDEIVRLLTEEIEMDPTFKPFFEFCNRDSYEFIILSGGFSICIDTILKKYNLEGIRYYSNNLVWKGNKTFIEYPFSAEECKECGNCKTMHLKRCQALGYWIIYIGDSTTDRCPARYADLVFAKDNLSEYCSKKGIAYIPFANFSDIQAYLMQEAAVVDSA